MKRGLREIKSYFQMNKPKIIFFGNGLLAECALAILEKHCEIIFHAREKADLEVVKKMKVEHPEAKGVLASFGVMIKSDVLEIFEPEGILNIHPSLLPKYRGASPIESAILAGDTEFSVSVMKLAKAMDAGPVYYQETLRGLPLNKQVIYKELAETGAKWIVKNLMDLPEPIAQDEEGVTFTSKLDKTMSWLKPETETAEQILRKIVAYQGFPKPKYAVCGQNCIILEVHIAEVGEIALLPIECQDGAVVAVDLLQPEGKRPMDAKSFLNGYKR